MRDVRAIAEPKSYPSDVNNYWYLSTIGDAAAQKNAHSQSQIREYQFGIQTDMAVPVSRTIPQKPFA
jgi:hypothetical protein